jgi:hypothetical protein
LSIFWNGGGLCVAGEAELVVELLAIPGVADADVAPDSAEGVKVTLAQGADATGVAAAVRDVLARHGLRSRMAPPRERIVPDVPPPPPIPFNVVPGPGLVQATIIPPREQVAQPAERPEPELGPEPEPEPEPGPVEDLMPAGLAQGAMGAAAEDHLEAVRVEERREGVAVTVVTRDGRAVTKAGRNSDSGVFEAVVAAVGEASGAVPAPVLVEVGESDLGGRMVMTVVLQRPDGSMLVGSALVGAEKAFAVARATWAAIAESG